MPTDYTYPGSVWANASPNKVWVLLDGNWWPIPPRFELSMEPVLTTCPPDTVPIRYVISMGSSDDQGWIDIARANYLFDKARLGGRITFATNMFDDSWKNDRVVYIVPPVRIWPVDPLGRYYQYDIRLTTNTLAIEREGA